MNVHLPSRSIWNIALSLCALVFAVISPARILSAQQPDARASITGTIVDSKGSLVRDAAITIKNETTGAANQVTTDTVGHFAATGIPAGSYTLVVTAAGFAPTTQTSVLASAQPTGITIAMGIGSVSENVEVRAIAGDSVAAQHALSQISLEVASPQSNISSEFINEFTPPTTDYSEIINIAPGVVSYNSNGVGLGQGTVYFRGFIDGDFNYTWDGIPEGDTNNPTHHSWVYFPGPWIGSVNFDRSPGTASTIGEATYGGSINLLSPEVPRRQSADAEVSFGSFNTLLVDGKYNSGMIGPHKNFEFAVDVHRLTTDGFETLNYLKRTAGDIKVVYNLSDRTTITGFSGVLHLFANAPNNLPYRAQVDTYGWNYLMENNDSTSAFYQAYNTNTIPTDFEYVGVHSVQKRGWFIDVKPYTYSYNNLQYYANDSGNDTTGLIGVPGGDGSTGFITAANCVNYNPPQYLAADKGASPNGSVKDPCAIDKLNSYRKYGELSTISQTSKRGVFRTGMWYEWSATNRYQFPSNPLNHQDQLWPNFHENYWINSYNPFVEYEWHATKKLTITAGDKYAYYTFSLKQYADDGKVVGSLCPTTASSAGCVPFVTSSAGFGSNLPSAEANYRLTSYWSAYGQFAKGDEIPPSSIFDVAGGGSEVNQPGKPQLTSAYQGGTVIKKNLFTLDADYYVVRFQNNYIAVTSANPNNPLYDLNAYVLGPDSTTQGFEAETNASLSHGFNVYANGTVGKATYRGSGVPSGLNVADTPSYTQDLALTYQQHGLDLGIIEKRVGSYYDDNGNGPSVGNNGGVYHNQVYIAPNNNVNLFLNYTIRKSSFFDGSKISFSINNLFNTEAITDVAAAGNPIPVGGSANPSEYLTTALTAPSALDQVGLNAGRSFTISFKLGAFPGFHK